MAFLFFYLILLIEKHFLLILDRERRAYTTYLPFFIISTKGNKAVKLIVYAITPEINYSLYSWLPIQLCN